MSITVVASEQWLGGMQSQWLGGMQSRVRHVLASCVCERPRQL